VSAVVRSPTKLGVTSVTSSCDRLKVGNRLAVGLAFDLDGCSVYKRIEARAKIDGNRTIEQR
jgi:hypothetical protein